MSLPTISAAALKARARRMLVDMTERSRWIYALPRDGSRDKLAALLLERGIPRIAEEANGSVAKYGGDEACLRLVVFDSAPLGVVLLEGAGNKVVPVLKAILEATGFVPQSELWRRALDIGDPGATVALTTLAHMMVVWDDDWRDLFLLHLASPDAVVRKDACLAVTLAAMVAQDVDPALELLSEARRRERFPQLAASFSESIAVLEAFDRRPMDLAALGWRAGDPSPA